MKTNESMKAMHTPGPWRKSNLNAWIYGAQGEYVTRVEGPDTATEEANARLIAAAPDLLEALKRLLRANESDYEIAPNVDTGTAFETNSQAISQARAAIHLATQGSSEAAPRATGGEA